MKQGVQAKPHPENSTKALPTLTTPGVSMARMGPSCVTATKPSLQTTSTTLQHHKNNMCARHFIRNARYNFRRNMTACQHPQDWPRGGPFVRRQHVAVDLTSSVFHAESLLLAPHSASLLAHELCLPVCSPLHPSALSADASLRPCDCDGSLPCT